jgi:hypothetical protein
MARAKKKEDATPPRPIPKRDCKCGYEHKFQPNRTNQIYLNKQHGDFGYNHGTRKKVREKQLEIETTLRHNDRILAKYHNAYQTEEAVCFLNILVAEGFERDAFVGYSIIESNGFFYSYRYMFHIYKTSKQELIKIRKR